VGLVPRAALLERISKSDSVARHRLSSLALVQVVVWLSEGSSVMSRDRKERCCDAKRLLPGSVRGIGTGESCCEVKVNLWGVCTG
jgi:hypothetical protein